MFAFKGLLSWIGRWKEQNFFHFHSLALPQGKWSASIKIKSHLLRSLSPPSRIDRIVSMKVPLIWKEIVLNVTHFSLLYWFWAFHWLLRWLPLAWLNFFSDSDSTSNMCWSHLSSLMEVSSRFYHKNVVCVVWIERKKNFSSCSAPRSHMDFIPTVIIVVVVYFFGGLILQKMHSVTSNRCELSITTTDCVAELSCSFISFRCHFARICRKKTQSERKMIAMQEVSNKSWWSFIIGFGISYTGEMRSSGGALSSCESYSRSFFIQFFFSLTLKLERDTT